MQNDVNVSAGPLTSKQVYENGVRLYSDSGIFDIRIYSASIIRVTFSKPDRKPIDFSYAVQSPPLPTRWVIEEKTDTIIIKTESMGLVIHCNPIRFCFLDRENHTLNEEHPSFGTSWIAEKITSYRKLQPHERFIGLGEKTGNLDRRGSAYTNWNTDRFAYPVNADPLYLSIPFYIGINRNRPYGVFLDSPSKTVFNFGASNNRFSYFSTELGSMRYYFIHDTDIRKIIEAYTWLTGRQPLPPIWSLGYQQCRYSYMSAADVVRLAKTFREKRIPCDAIYLDIHYMDNYKSFTWDRDHFADPQRLVKDLKDLGFSVVTILDPGIKVEEDYDVYQSGKAKAVFIKYPDGKDYVAKVWPGDCVFPDFTNPETRRWWETWMERFIDIGIDGFWTDMNEPSSWGQCIPDLLALDYDGHHVSHQFAHNVYGLQMARATFEGAKRCLKNIRPFVLSRSGFSGIQNYAAVWTGDNVSADDHLLLGSRMLNSLGLSGVPFAGNDIGGFVGDASRNLYARWLGLGVFTPLFRSHSMLNSKSAEPWCFGEAVENIAKQLIRLRYLLLPYIYSAFYECSRTGLPIVRSLAIDYSADDNIFEPGYQNQYLFGDFFLVSPVASEQEMSTVYLPEGDWYDFFTDERISGKKEFYAASPISRPPVFVRSGGVIPMRNHVGVNADDDADSLSFHVYQGDSPVEYIYYEDDGWSYGYKQGAFYKRSITHTPNTLILGKPEGKSGSKYKHIDIVFHGFDFPNGSGLSVNGAHWPIVKKSIQDCIPIDGENSATPGNWGDDLVGVNSVRIENVREAIHLSFGL